MNPESNMLASVPDQSIDEDAAVPQDFRKANRTLPQFLRTLFQLLDRAEVRYCVIHSWTLLPYDLPNDLDLAVHLHDKFKLLSVFDSLRSLGYYPFQALNHSNNGFFFVFYWNEISGAKTAAVDIVFEHRRGGMSLATGEQMVANRIWREEFWVSSPSVEFAYLLAKKCDKQKASLSQLNRLSALAQEIGLPEAERSARRFLPASCSRLAATLCLNGGVDEFLKNGKAQLWRASCFRHPLRLAHYLAKEGLRLIRRWFQPTGVLVAVLGPDGVGKSTMIEGLVKIMDIAFWRRHRLFHWRPNIIARKNSVGPVTDPHGKPDRGRLTSMAFLFVFFVDYWIGYLFSIRPLLAKSNLVIFDRYLHDVLVDSRRFRYGGPRWFAQMLCQLAPQPDLVILLDADAESISARKSELPNEEIQRQRRSYSQLRFRRVDITVVPTDGGIGFAIQASCCAVAEYMKRRFNARFLGWLSTANSVLEPK